VHSSTFSILKILLSGKNSIKFLLGIVLSFSFSITVILATIGIMDGFDVALKKGLRKAEGDLKIQYRGGFFELEQIEDKLDLHPISEITGIVRSEAFLISKDRSKGIVLRGVEPDSFNEVTKFKLELVENDIVLGHELLAELGLSIGDEVVIVFASGRGDHEQLPTLHRFKVVGDVSHGIYEKDLRYAYVNLTYIQKLFGLENQINQILLNVEGAQKIDSPAVFEKITTLGETIEDQLNGLYRAIPFWIEYGGLIEAVKVEKVSITIVLQIVVVVSIFNVLAFVMFLGETRSKEIFLVEALGISKKVMNRAWVLLLCGIWGLSCFVSFFLVEITDYGLQNLSMLELPGDVYTVSKLALFLEPKYYGIVFLISLVWVLVISAVTLYRMSRKEIIQGLRQEFS
jgi:ABC-type lipoprotein release transport system permease subunit